MSYTPYRPSSAWLGLAAGIGLPLAGYYTLHAMGADDWLALLVATAAAGARLIAVALWTRRVSWFAAIMLGVFGVGLALAFIGGSPRFLLLKDSFTTAVIGAVFLSSLAGSRPLTLSAAQSWRPGLGEELERLYREVPAGRRAFRISTLGWGLGMLAEAVLRIPLIYLLPIEVMVGLSTALMIAAMILLTLWNAAYITSAARREPVLEVLLPGSMRGRAGRQVRPDPPYAEACPK